MDRQSKAKEKTALPTQPAPRLNGVAVFVAVVIYLIGTLLVIVLAGGSIVLQGGFLNKGKAAPAGTPPATPPAPPPTPPATK